MTNKPIDKSKRSNWRCASCGNWVEKKFESGICLISGKPRHYYNRCKADFVWREDKTYANDK